MSSHFKNVNIKSESCKGIPKPSIFAFLCSLEARERFFTWVFWQLGEDQVWAFRIPVGHESLVGNRVSLSGTREGANQAYNQNINVTLCI